MIASYKLVALIPLFCFLEFAFAQRSGQTAEQLCRSGGKNVQGSYPHEEYCDYYYNCDNTTGEAVLQACPNGLAYAGNKRGITQNCDYPHRVGCPDGQRVMGQSPQGTDNCQWQYGVFPHATSCTRYWHCWNGTSTIQQCPFSLLYNDNIHSCDWPDNVPDCQKHPICKDIPNGAVQIEKSCARYWLCVGGYPRLQRCPAGLAFNPAGLKCELAQTVPGCEPPPTTPAPEEDDEELPTGPGGAAAAPTSSQSQGRPRPQGQPLILSQPQQNQPTGPLPQRFAPAQSGVRLLG